MMEIHDQLDLLNLDRALTPAERKRLFRSTRTKKRGHAAPPGTGPAGETCKTCEHIVGVRHARKYLKCNLSRARWTGGYGTDIRAGDAACKLWEERK